MMPEIVILGPKHSGDSNFPPKAPYYDAMHYGKIFCDKISVIDSLTSNLTTIGWVFDMYMPPATL